MAWLARGISGLKIYDKEPYRDILYSLFAFKCNGVFISLPNDADKKLIGKELKLGDEQVEI